jgi:hypothetical protein
MAAGIRVIGFAEPGPIGYGRAFIRAIGRYISAIALLIGYLWMLWDDERQTWHDKACRRGRGPGLRLPAAEVAPRGGVGRLAVTASVNWPYSQPRLTTAAT